MPETSETRHPHSPTSPRIYPDLEWYLRTGERHMRDGSWLPLLVQFNAKGIPNYSSNSGERELDAFLSLRWLPDRLWPAVYKPPVFSELSIFKSKAEFPFCVIWIWRDQLEQVMREPGWNNVIVAAELGPASSLPNRDAQSSLPSASQEKKEIKAADKATEPLGRKRSRGQQRGSTTWRWLFNVVCWLRSYVMQQTVPGSAAAAAAAPPPVLTAVLDEGIAFAHERFRSATNTRIAYFWNQEGTAGPPPPGWFGTELDAIAINTAVNLAKTSGIGDEASAHASKGELSFSRPGFKAIAHHRSHGTHVLDLAAGDDPLTASASRPIIAVQMPERAIADTSGTRLEPYKILGILYVMQRAQLLAQNLGGSLPVVINLSYGRYAGPHDGMSLFELVVDGIVSAYDGSATPLRMVLAAGNHRQGRSHAQFSIGPGQSQQLSWRVQPDDRTRSYMELWLTPRTGARVQVTLKSPSGQSLTVSPSVSAQFHTGPTGFLFGVIYVVSATAPSRIGVWLEPTAPAVPLDTTQPTVGAGVWNLIVNNIGSVNVSVDGYIQRDDTLRGRRPMGRQSYFDDPLYQRHDSFGKLRGFDPAPNPSYVVRRGALSGNATGTYSYVIGGYVRDPNPIDLMPAPYSSQGPIRTGAGRAMRSPNWLAPCEDSMVCRGILAAGTRSGTRVAMNGTSVSAPQAARWYADQFANGTIPDFTTPPAGLLPPSARVPATDVPLACGNGLMPLPVNGRRP